MGRKLGTGTWERRGRKEVAQRAGGGKVALSGSHVMQPVMRGRKYEVRGKEGG